MAKWWNQIIHIDWKCCLPDILFTVKLTTCIITSDCCESLRFLQLERLSYARKNWLTVNLNVSYNLNFDFKCYSELYQLNLVFVCTTSLSEFQVSVWLCYSSHFAHYNYFNAIRSWTHESERVQNVYSNWAHSVLNSFWSFVRKPQILWITIYK